MCVCCVLIKAAPGVVWCMGRLRVSDSRLIVPVLLITIRYIYDINIPIVKQLHTTDCKTYQGSLSRTMFCTTMYQKITNEYKQSLFTGSHAIKQKSTWHRACILLSSAILHMFHHPSFMCIYINKPEMSPCDSSFA